MQKFHFSAKLLARQALIAAAYTVLTYTAQGFAYGPIQFRYSEILTWLAFLDPKNVIGLTLGCFLSNLGSPLGLIDVFFGSFHTLVAVLFMAKMSSKYIAALGPALFSFIIAGELAIIGEIPPSLFMETYGTIALSEFVIVALIGLPVMVLLTRFPAFTNTVIDRTMEPVKE